MIKGSYVCMVTIDFNIEEGADGLKSFNELEDIFVGDGLTNSMRNILDDTLGSEDGVSIGVIKVFGNIMKERERRRMSHEEHNCSENCQK